MVTSSLFILVQPGTCPSPTQYTYSVDTDYTSHASIAYHKQLTPQRTVGTIGSVWQESTPLKETTGPAQTNTQSETAVKTNSRKWKTAHARPLLEPMGFSQLDLILDLSLRLLLPPAVSSNVATFLQLSTPSSGEDHWLNLQIQCSRRMVYANLATTADWLTPVLVLLRASRY